MALILGLNAFHADAAAWLVSDGKLVAAVAEERLGKRFKHDSAFQAEAIRSVFKMGSADIKDLDYVALGHSLNANLGAKAKYV